MNSINTFHGGMNSDISKLYQSNKEYLKALNMRPVTSLGGSNGALQNIKGNACNMTFPQIKGLYKLDMIGTEGGSITISINGQSITIPTTPNTRVEDVLSYIKSMSNCYQGVYDSNKTFAACVKDGHLFIYQQPEYQGCNPISSVEPDIEITINSGDRAPVFIYEFGYSHDQHHYVKPPDPNDPIVVIGSTYINEVNYILTCTSNNIFSTGQIWELTYDTTQERSTLKLLYNNVLNFSKDHPVPPSAFIGRYEVPTIQRIYWTDNSNPVRSVNVKDPNLMGLDIDLVNSTPSIEMSIPMLSALTDGGAVTPLNCNATYQVAYRLKKGNSSVSNFSIPSALVVPQPYSISGFLGSGTDFAKIDGVNNVTTDKSITWTVEGVDPSYDYIEFFIIYRGYPDDDIFTINKYEEQSIHGNSTISTVYTNDLDLFEEITMNEFLLENSSFTHCKTIEQKDNRLFYANVKSELSEIVDELDTRTYRFPAFSTSARVKRFETDPGVTDIDLSTTYDNVPETDDNIPVINLGMDTNDDPNYDGTHKYQKNSDVIGGEGPNIKYTFGMQLLRSDSQANLPAVTTSGSFNEGSTRDVGSSPNTYKHGYRRPGQNNSGAIMNYATGSPDQTFEDGLVRESMAFEYLNGTFRGYQLREIYRFGILFYGKNGTTSFVKHIGDIKFPAHGDDIPPDLQPAMNSGAKVTTFRDMAAEGSDAYCCIPYIQFKVTISEELSNIISGYQIVRVQRDSTDRTIPAQGLVTQSMVANFTGSSNSYVPIPNLGLSGGTKSMDPDTGTAGGKAWNNEVLFESFDYLCDKHADNIEDNDKLIFTQKYSIFNNGGLGGVVWPEAGSPPSSGFSHINYYHIKKYYNMTGTYNTIYKLSGGVYAESDQQVTQPSLSRDFINRAPFSSSKFYSKGSPVHALAIKTSFKAVKWSDYNGGGNNVVNGNSKMLALHYKPSRLKAQYGGRTYIARTSNQYITCGAYYKSDDTVGVTTLNVFGGDIYSGIIDCQRAIRENISSPAPVRCSQTWYFPATAIRNVDLRVGIKVNSDLNDETTINARDRDEYFFNDGYAFENTIHRYLTKPADFNSTSLHTNRIYWSEPKINAETYDSWITVPVNNYYDVDGNYGPINCLITLRSNLYCIQESATAVLMVSPSAMVVDQNTQSLRLGVGEVLEKHNYMSVDIGTKHQWSVSRSPSHITFCDARTKKIYLFDGQNLVCTSDVKGSRGFLNKALVGVVLSTDNPVIHRGILTTYDFTNNEFLYSFHNITGVLTFERYTLVYSDATNSFTSFYDACPYIYISNRSRIYSPEAYYLVGNENKLYLHNVGNYGEFYGDVYPSSVKISVNPNPMSTKVFDNLSWVSESYSEDGKYDEINDFNFEDTRIIKVDDTIARVRCYNDYQNTDWVNMDQTAITGNLRNNEEGYTIQVPRNKINWDTTTPNNNSIFDSTILTKTSFGERMRDKTLVVDLEYDNTPNNRFILHNLNSTFRISDR